MQRLREDTEVVLRQTGFAVSSKSPRLALPNCWLIYPQKELYCYKFKFHSEGFLIDSAEMN